MKAEDSRSMAVSTLISSPQVRPAANDETTSFAQSDLWIFRDGRKYVSGPEMVRDLKRRISVSGRQGRSLLDSLIEAGALEAALADANSCDTARASTLTDELALAVCVGGVLQDKAIALVEQLRPPGLISFSPPEGFSYYALHPLDFAHLISRIPSEPPACALIGIRSIGTTLSAMCAAALRQAGRSAVSRITVRPTGHPYSRRTEFSQPEMTWIREQLRAAAQFLIVDEGPGRSGSTFLSVAEALIGAGVPNERITILGSRQADPQSLCATDAAARWQAFRFLSTTPSVNTRFEPCTYVGGGHWRDFMFCDVAMWPESWTQMERLKFICPDRKNLFKFEGMGPVGAEVRGRAFVLGDAGFSPATEDIGDGFLQYELVKGQVMRAKDLSAPLLKHMARYCAFRLSHFAVQSASASELKQMLEFNVQQEFGVELQIPQDAFASQVPVLCDGRMQPYEWVRAQDGNFYKADAISHGDDHFFPGPCGIAWDLAGISIEWQLETAAREYLVTEFEQQAQAEVGSKLPIAMLAYAVFRLGFCKMGVSAVRGSPEELRLDHAYQHYRAIAEGLLQQLHSTGSGSMFIA
jgi:hypothetical protein